ncbi:spore germination protein GerPE [Metabacillus halosaccharovorans]|uniref:spore germination protein GerPE n=1 Tax=Metabacillus halosaccharovorans TaxID=930124 RepID=UPI001C1F8BA5|nr:spore germination protein GerPE [Metabacillus halosaccharovorans]MBU7590980.1 spore germination protein GerPE [Metabacillus halosaccharovorans]
MINRQSNVSSAYVNSVGLSSVFQIGDSFQIKPTTNVLAVQREEERFFDYEGDTSMFQAFQEEIPQPIIYEEITTNFFHEKPMINVSFVNIAALSSSAVFHIGSTKDIIAEARVKHIRQLKGVNG